jgi:UDP-3-O-[3-hydroxymyristoyl] glucosamine N-acyltransferase LpxD
VIEAEAEIGPGSRIGPCAAIGRGVIVGRDCRIGAHVSLSHALLGARVCVYPGARIGQEGFGFAYTKDGFLSVPQLGRVILEDDVEVGANTTIDRGSSQDTVIGAGSRLDNLVQIGHNVVLGRCCVRSCGRAGGPDWASSDRRTRGDRGTGGRHVGCGSRCQIAWKSSSAYKGLLQANCYAHENGKETA